jgi:hypothetical protein
MVTERSLRSLLPLSAVQQNAQVEVMLSRISTSSYDGLDQLRRVLADSPRAFLKRRSLC